jgi:hypothetical protein
MFDTQHTLELTEESLALDDPKYPKAGSIKAIRFSERDAATRAAAP